MIYLYVKIHNSTGLKYLGKTEKDPFTYKGSGKYWLRHIKKHGNNTTTKVLLISENSQEIKEKGIYFSKLWNIVESKNWANLKLEEGDGGDTSNTPNYLNAKENKLFSKSVRGKSYEEIYGYDKAQKLKFRRIETNINRGKRSNSTKLKISETRKRLIKEGKILSKPVQTLLTCPHCFYTTTYGNAHRWHFNKCKFK